MQTLEDVAKVSSWVLPFEALYQAGLHGLTQDTGGITGVIVQLGPFGGAQEAGAGLWLWALAYWGLSARRRGPRSPAETSSGPDPALSSDRWKSLPARSCSRG